MVGSATSAPPGKTEHDSLPVVIIAVDGPSGSGKSSTARGVATRLGLRYLDTGAMYRAATWLVLHDRIELADRDAIAQRVGSATFEIGTDPQDPRFSIDGHDVTAAIREPEISQSVSAVATVPAVRTHLVAAQQQIIADAGGDIVVEGRDIATVVAPNAPLKVLLTADPAARMARRQAELSAGDRQISDADLADQIIRRDDQDAQVAQFRIPADGAVEIDSTQLTLEQVIDRICAMAVSVADAAEQPVPDAGTEQA